MEPRAFDKLVRVVISSDRLSATVAIQPGIQAANLTNELIDVVLEQHVILRSPERDEAVSDLVRCAIATPDRVVEAVVVRGQPPVHGEAGRFVLAEEFTRKLLPEEAAPPTSESVDHYSRSPFQIVRVGARVGTLLPPKPGRDGADVTGTAIACKAALPAPLRTDHTVEIRGDQGVYATVEGVVSYKDNYLRILDTLEIEEYVDFSTGHIDFPGHVHIGRGVRDRFMVKATGTLVVRELIEGARVETLGDAQLDRGMAAREHGFLSVGRDLSAKYLDNIEARIERDAYITNEIANCSVYVGRKFSGPTCSVVGGELTLAHEGEIGRLGTDGGVTTRVVLGRIPEIEEQVRRLVPTIIPMRERVGSLELKLAQIAQPGARLPASQVVRLKELQGQLELQKDRLKKLLDGLDACLRIIRANERASLVVNRLVCPGARVWIGVYRLEIDHEIAGPLRLGTDECGNPVITDLNTHSKAPAGQYSKVFPDDRFVDVLRLRQDCQLLAAA